jgi:hypothetical protein
MKITLRPDMSVPNLGDNWLSEISTIREAKNCSLLLVTSDGEVRYGSSRRDRDSIVDRFSDSSDLLLLYSHEKYKTHTFRLRTADLEKNYGRKR